MNLTDIRGIGKTNAKKLKKMGITSIQDLREMNIKKLSKIPGLGATRLQQWQEEARSMRIISDIKGIGTAYQKRLEKQGVSTIKDLAQADQHIAEDIGVSKKRFNDWLRQARSMVEPIKPVMKTAVVAETIDANNTAIILKGKIAQVKIKEKIHTQVPVFRGASMDDLATKEFIAVHVDSTGSVRLWFNNTWHENIPFSVESVWQKIKRMVVG